MKSISKYCTPLKQKQLELCSSQIFRRSVPSSTNLPLVQKRIQSCYLPGEVGGAFERESLGSSALIWAMGDGRTLAVIRNRDIGSGNTSEHWLKWPWNWAMLEYRLWLRCCPSSLSEALVECWLVMLWDVWCAPFLVLFKVTSGRLIRVCMFEISLAGLQKYSCNRSGLKMWEKSGLWVVCNSF